MRCKNCEQREYHSEIVIFLIKKALRFYMLCIAIENFIGLSQVSEKNCDTSMVFTPMLKCIPKCESSKLCKSAHCCVKSKFS